jgi:hypothetical protein
MGGISTPFKSLKNNFSPEKADLFREEGAESGGSFYETVELPKDELRQARPLI